MKRCPSHITSFTILLIASLVLAYGSAQAQPVTSAAPEDASGQVGTPASQGTQPASSGLPSDGNATTRPWNIGVSSHQQKHAEGLYQEGNRDFTNGFFASAVTKYQAALQHWKHPGIHYNLALALISLDRPIEAYESIIAALAHGADGLHPDEYQRATDYRHVLRRRIAEVEVVCDQPGAAVTLDGKPLFTGPGRVTTMVLPGKHQVVASKSGYLVTTKSFDLTPAGRKRIEVHLLAANQPGRQTQRWPTWPQWTATGLGLGASAAAAVLHWQFSVDTDGLERLWRERCPVGCTTPSDVTVSLRQRVEWQRKVAYAGYATAGAFLTLGAVLAYLNRPQTVEATVPHETMQISAGGPDGSAGISVHIPF